MPARVVSSSKPSASKSTGGSMAKKKSSVKRLDSSDEDEQDESFDDDFDDDGEFHDAQDISPAIRQKSGSRDNKGINGKPRKSLERPALSIIEPPPPRTRNPRASTGGLAQPNPITQQQLLGKPAMNAPRSIKKAVEAEGMPQVSMEVMNTNFEEWMKMATDNKITATNTWNFALIDYFADLTLLRNGPNDQSINFQKASCTLDGCVKIYNSRVDSVATETGKLLSGLAGGGDKMDEDEDDEADAAEEAEKKEKRKTQKSEATLAKSFAALSVKKFDLEFAVDPLFKKTSADFDEGGAMGLLMNHLGVDRTGRVVFDSGDVEDEDEADEPIAGGDEDHQQAYHELSEEDDEPVDVAKLQEFIPDLETITSKNISVTLGDFKFSADPGAAFDLAFLATNEEDEHHADGHPAASGGPVGDFFGDDDLGDTGEGGFGGDDDPFLADEGTYGMGSDGPTAFGQSPTSGETVLAPFDPSRQAGSEGLVMAMLKADEGQSMMLDYFDQQYLKNWAGPEHWKLRKVTKKVPDQSTSAGGEVADKPTRKEKTAFEIDFEDDNDVNVRELFAPASSSSISLPTSRIVAGDAKKRGRARGKKTGSTESRDKHLLPDDMHFSSRELLTLFLKPKFVLKMRRQRHLNDPIAADGDDEIDENFWAQAAGDNGGVDAGFDDDGGVAPTAFGSQYFHDDADDGASFAEVEDALDLGPELEDDDLMTATQQLKKSRPDTVHYAKRAKKVDVKRLKDNIWKGLKIQRAVPDLNSEDESEGPATPRQGTPTPVSERVFEDVIDSLRESYPTEKMSEISTSFCFICLLHLANEQGLKIEPARTDGGNGIQGMMGYAEGIAADGSGKARGLSIDEETDRLVGELQALKITKDPDAGQAA